MYPSDPTRQKVYVSPRDGPVTPDQGFFLLLLRLRMTHLLIVEGDVVLRKIGILGTPRL